MAKFVRNPDGAVHSVPDDFVTPEGWADVTEADASPQLRGEPDPQVEAAKLHDLAAAPVDEVPSSGEIGVPVDITPTPDEHAADAPVEPNPAPEATK